MIVLHTKGLVTIKHVNLIYLFEYFNGYFFGELRKTVLAITE